MHWDTRCEPRAAGGCNGQPDTTNAQELVWSGPSWQLVGGVEGRMASRVTAFGGVRWLATGFNAGDTGLGALGGVRVALRGQEPLAARPSGHAVRVSLIRGDALHGTLVSLTSAEVVIERNGHTQAFPLDQVSRVKRTTHHVRNGVLWGLVLGFAGGYLGSCGAGDEEDCWPEVGALFAGIGAGAGALIGAGVNLATARSHVLYPVPDSSISVMPRVSPSRAGVEMTVRF